MNRQLPNLAIVSAAAVVALLGLDPTSHAQCLLNKLRPGDIATSDFFGSALSLSHEPGGVPVCAMGMVADDSANGLNAGSVRFATRSGAGVWSMTPALTLTGTGGQASDAFGAAVSYDYPNLIVGATGANNSRGATWLFRRVGPGWNYEGTLPGPSGPGSGFAHFGQSVGVSGDWAVIGAPYQSWPIGNATNSGAGAVYFYQRQLNGQWTQQQIEYDADNSNVDTGAHLGWSVAIAGDLAVTGMRDSRAPDYAGPPAVNHGAIHIFRKSIFDAWISETADAEGYADPSVQANDQFGAAVSTDGITIAVGAPQDDLDPSDFPDALAKQNSGCVYMLKKVGNQWVSDGRIFAPTPTDNATFGSSVTVVGTRVAIAASGVKKAYIYHRAASNDWVLDAEIADPDGPDGFGSAVAFDGTNILVGDMNDNENGLVDSGAVYAAAPAQANGDSCDSPIFFSGDSMTGCTTFATVDIKAACDNSAGGSPDVWFSWTPACTGNAIVDTIGSGYDTILSIHSACPGGVRGGIFSTYTMVCNDDTAPFGTASMVSFNYTAGTTYLIRVGGYNGAKGDFVLRINQWQTPANDSCSASAVIADGITPFGTCAATTDGPSECGFNGAIVKDIWFNYTSPVNGFVTVKTCGANFDTKLAVYAGTACPSVAGGALVCNDDAPAGSASANTTQSVVTFAANHNAHYLIRVGGYSLDATGHPSAGSGNLTITSAANCPCDWNQSSQISVQDIFDFLSSYFSGSGDFNNNGLTTVQDIFDFLACYFAGCI